MNSDARHGKDVSAPRVTRVIWYVRSASVDGALGDGLWVVETMILAVWRFARRPSAEVTGGPDLVIAFLAEQLDEPCLVFDFFVQNPGRHIVRARILPEGEIADFAPGADSTTLGFEQHGEDIGGRGSVRKIGIRASRAVRKVADVLRNSSAKLVNARGDEFKMSAIFQSSILAPISASRSTIDR
jgi:hypothetical protein